jgi:hypothetical protein
MSFGGTSAVTVGGRALSLFSGLLRPPFASGRLKGNPGWAWPLAAAAAYSAIVNLYLIRRIGFARLIGNTIQTNAAFDPQSVVDVALQRRTLILSIQTVSSVAGAFLTAAIVAGTFWLVLAAIGKEIPLGKLLAAVAHATMLTAVLKQSMLAITATVMRDTSALDLRNPLATNLAFVLRPASPQLHRLLSSLDAVVALHLFLLVVGLTLVSSRISTRLAATVVVGPWVAYTLTSSLLPL